MFSKKSIPLNYAASKKLKLSSKGKILPTLN